MAHPHEYTVGWICAVTPEYVAAQAFLDEKQQKRPRLESEHDNNHYTLGKIGEHNVVLVTLPEGEYGMVSAASVAKDLLYSFPNLRIVLMVGIGGGAPSPHRDIRLGDIVVSIPRDGKGGVFHYDFGKTIQDQAFRHTSYLNQPPAVLRAAVRGLRTEYEIDGHQLDAAIDSALSRKPRLRKGYSRPDPSSDRLYRSEVTHPLNVDSSCSVVCSQNPSHLVERNKRSADEDDPAIHYGVIASGSQLMKNALIRDKLAAEADILCFEMEAAGLMNQFPCLVVRGICDYSDSHKNKEWQGYAAMAAAAYAKDLLGQIAPNKIEAEKKIREIPEIHEVLSGLHDLAKKHRDIAEERRDIAREALQADRDYAKERLSEKEQKCHQLFRLTGSNGAASYEWYKDRVEERVENTCMWFLNHENFQTWLKSESGPLLVSADPGCGKSVLAKYLIDHYLPQSITICYFFFKDQDQNTVRQALCGLLHQFFSQNPSLIKHAMTQYEKDGAGLVKSTGSLWNVLRNAIKDPQAGPTTIVLDALDECAETEFPDLVRNVECQFRGDQLCQGKVKYLMTCRPYQQLLSKFRNLLESFPRRIRIPGEEESETISHEVTQVITYRVSRLDLSPRLKVHLEESLQKNTNRTYLWVYLAFKYLEEHLDARTVKRTLQGIDDTMKTVPKSVHEAYEQILNKSKDRSMVRKALSIMLAASRPLTLSEMNIAVSLDNTSQRMDELDLEDDDDFKLRLRSWCGLFITVHQDRVHFLHQTAREFLLADLSSSVVGSSQCWNQSFTIDNAHNVLAAACVAYLNFFNFDASIPTGTDEETSHATGSRAFLEYSAESWSTHFRESCISDAGEIAHSALRICDPDSPSYSTWFKTFWRTTGLSEPRCFTDLMVASYCGHYTTVKLLHERRAVLEAKEARWGGTALSWGIEGGHESVVELLLEAGAEVNLMYSAPVSNYPPSTVTMR